MTFNENVQSALEKYHKRITNLRLNQTNYRYEGEQQQQKKPRNKYWMKNNLF